MYDKVSFAKKWTVKVFYNAKLIGLWTKEPIVQNHLIITPHAVYSATFITNIACSKVTRRDIYNNKTVGVANNGELFEIHQV